MVAGDLRVEVEEEEGEVMLALTLALMMALGMLPLVPALTWTRWR